MANYVLGLDIGIGSVGVGLIEKETGEIIHKSVSLFPSGDAASNVERRVEVSVEESVLKEEKNIVLKELKICSKSMILM